MQILTQIRFAFTIFRHRLARRIAPDLAWNPDISRENDALRIQIEALHERIREMGGD